MIYGLKKVKQQPLILGLILLYLLPPVGMAWFVGYAIIEWRAQFIEKKSIPTDLISILLALMAISSIGAVLVSWQVTDLASTLILVGYLGIYLFMLRHPEQLHIHQFTWITVFGGVYIFISDKLLNFIPKDTLIGQAASFLTGHFLFGYVGKPRLYGSTFNPNYACYLLILALAFLLVELLRAVHMKNTKLIALSLVILPLLDLGIYDTGSRAGFVIMFLLHLLFVYKLNLRLFFPIAALVIASAPFLYRWMPRSDGTESSMAKRIEIWGNSWHIFKENPVFGATSLGFGRDYAELNGQNIPHAHDLFLAIFSTSGVFCGLFFLFVLCISGFTLLRAQRLNTKTNDEASLFFFTMPTIIAYGIMDFELSSPQVLIIVLILLSYWTRYAAALNQFIWLRKITKLFLHTKIHLLKRKKSNAAMLQSYKEMSGK
ncbi:O-antigen ligase family protein [Sporolactobacillus kofuensis]|uniref:O-antigen ligase family protein n=1 Tax=Sporolactobacillus kofuensis TaxID=269672 RepID=A0ABW1WFK6_9BACL|nr:O-antigen ligase family protein [Sporolactobacillus kofuensis]MCO7175334.1 O-antigen ligase family protein [Sporolactobacillus kofuensis]